MVWPSGCQINTLATALLPGIAYTCIAANQVEENYPVNNDYLQALENSSVAPNELILKPYTPIILIRNLNIARGLCNGTRLLVKQVINGAIIEAMVMSGHATYIGTTVFIPRIKLFGDDTLPFKWSRLQFPVRIAFAITINKSQGQTFEHVVLCFFRNCFSHGQFYVAASRVGDPNNLTFFLLQNANSLATNIVYREVLVKWPTCIL